jgi:flagellar biosynthetic protein FlhB
MSDSGDKKHAPTARKLRQAAERGDIRRSTDLPKAAAVMAVCVIGTGAAAGLGVQLQGDCAAWLSLVGTARPDAAYGWAATLALLLGPLLVLIAAVGTAAGLASGGWVFATALLKFDWSKMLPQHGLGSIVSISGMTETAKAMLKFALIGGVGALTVIGAGPQLFSLAHLSPPQTGPVIALALSTLTAICGATTLLGALDYAINFWLHRRRLRMSDADLREESKDSSGNPQIRQRQRAMARKMARARQMTRIAEASVIVTNPAHFAVAIRYRRGVDRAPLLLAKGVEIVAADIIARGRGHGIPVVEAPPLARAVYRYVEPGEHVPVDLYKACAEVLAYVWRMQRWRAQGGKRPQPPAIKTEDIVIAR